jgi:hypothetical protein
MEERLIESKEQQRPDADVEGFGNLVVLLNPAFEALLYAPMWDLSNAKRSYTANQFPLLAIMTSEADDATKIAFPIGRWFSTRFEKELTIERSNPVSGALETIDESAANITAVGHFTPFRTHCLRALAKRDSLAPITPDGSTRANYLASEGWAQDHTGGTIPFYGSVLTRTNDCHAKPNAPVTTPPFESPSHDPYLVIGVDKQLIRDHNDIWGDQIREFVTQLIFIVSQSSDPATREKDLERIKE